MHEYDIALKVLLQSSANSLLRQLTGASVESWVNAEFVQFRIISGLRRLSSSVEEEAGKMPILNDIMDHEVIGPAIRKGLQQGMVLKEGLQQGQKQGSHNVVRRLLERRYGPLPESISKRLAESSAEELEEISIRIFDADALEYLFPPR